MSFLSRLFGRKNDESTSDYSEAWYNDAGNRSDRKSLRVDPLSGKESKAMMDPVHNHIPGNGQDSNAIKKNGV